jgi:hypothetical protein
VTYHPARIVAGTQIRRVLRQVAASKTKILLYVVAGVVGMGPLLVIGTLLLSTAGEQLASGTVDSADLEPVPGIVSGVTAVFLIGLTVMATIRGFTNIGDVDEPACLLISTSLRNAAVGLVGAELALFGLWLAPLTLVLSGSFAYGAGTPLPVLTASLVLLVLLLVAVPVGFVVGVCIRHLLTVYEPIARYRTPLLVVLGVAYFAAIALGWYGSITTLLFELLGDSPLGWPGHVLLVGVPGVPFSAGKAVAGVAGVFVIAPVAMVAGFRAAAYHWFADPAQSDEAAEEIESGDRLASLLDAAVSTPVRTVTVTAIRRTKRAPIRLLYVAYPLFASTFFIQEIARTGTLPSYGAIALGLYVVWGAGAAFALNLLGDHGPAMESVLISTVSGREVVGGTVLAAAVVGAPVALLVAPVAGFVSPLSAAQTGLLVAGTLVGVVASPVLASGIGSLFPRFGSVRVMNKREAVMPSKTAFLLYTAAIMLPSLSAAILYLDGMASSIADMLTAFLTLAPAVSFTVTALLVTVVASILLVAGIVAPFLSVWYAIHRFDSYRPY